MIGPNKLGTISVNFVAISSKFTVYTPMIHIQGHQDTYLPFQKSQPISHDQKLDVAMWVADHRNCSRRHTFQYPQKTHYSASLEN